MWASYHSCKVFLFTSKCNLHEASTHILSAAPVTIATDLFAIYLRKHKFPPLLREHGPLAKKLMYFSKYDPRREMGGNKCTIWLSLWSMECLCRWILIRRWDIASEREWIKEMDRRCRHSEYIKENSWAGRRFDHQTNVWGRQIIHVPGVDERIHECVCVPAVQLVGSFFHFLYLAVACHQKQNNHRRDGQPAM